MCIQEIMREDSILNLALALIESNAIISESRSFESTSTAVKALL